MNIRIIATAFDKKKKKIKENKRTKIIKKNKRREKK